MLFYKVIKVVFMDICQRSSSSEIRIITLFYSEIIPLYRKPVFSVRFFVIFNCSLATPPVESIHKQHKNNEEKIKKPKHPVLHQMSRPWL